MIVSAIADPAVFGPEGIVDELSRREVAYFLEGIIENGILLSDPDRRFRGQSLKQAVDLAQSNGGTRLSQQVIGYLEDIWKNHRKYVACCSQEAWQKCEERSTAMQVRCIAEDLLPDVVVTTRKRLKEVETAVAGATEVISVSDVTHSRYDKRRRSFWRPDRSLDMMKYAELEEYLGRSLKFATRVSVFDSHIVDSVDRTRFYQEGINFFVRLWDKWCRVRTATPRTLEIFTTAIRQRAGGFCEGKESYRRLAKYVVGPLRRNDLNIMAYVKEESEKKIAHSRWWEANGRAYMIDPGFDAFGPHGVKVRCLGFQLPAGEGHLEDYKSLRTLETNP